MTTKNPRLNVTFESDVVNILSLMAQRRHTSMSSLVRELTLEALARHEDFNLSTIASQLDTPDTQLYSHEDAWK